MEIPLHVELVPNQMLGRVTVVSLMAFMVCAAHVRAVAERPELGICNLDVRKEEAAADSHAAVTGIPLVATGKGTNRSG